MGAEAITDLSAQRAAEGRLAAFARTLDAVPFFSAVGRTPSDAAAADARGYLDDLGLPQVEPAWVESLTEALGLIRRADTGRAWRAAEDAHRAELTRMTDALLGQSKAAHLLNEIMRQASEAATGAATALAAASAEPEAVKRAAAGAVIQSAYETALAEAADRPDNDPFRRKFALFRAGRWPLAVIGGRLHIY